jgi:hypothetical protein
MYGSLEFKSLIDQRHQEALQEAQGRRLAKLAQANDRSRSGRTHISLAWRTAVSLLRGARHSG